MNRLAALLTLWAFVFTTLAPSHGALSQAGERSVFFHYHYDEVGDLQSFATPNGVTHGYSYNALNRLTNLTAINAIGTIASYDYTQLRTGHRSAANESGTGILPVNTPITRGVKYQYDAFYRLRKETITANIGASGIADYALDIVGNRTGNGVKENGKTGSGDKKEIHRPNNCHSLLSSDALHDSIAYSPRNMPKSISFLSPDPVSHELEIAMYELFTRQDVDRAIFWLERSEKNGGEGAAGWLIAVKEIKRPIETRTVEAVSGEKKEIK